MAEQLETQLVQALNDYFNNTASQTPPSGIAYRDPEVKFHGQKIDVIVDNPYMGIECKSVKAQDNNKLYFSQHFSDEQVKDINKFLQRSGRIGWLAVELKHGRGKQRQAYILQWHKWVVCRFTDDATPGIPLNVERFETLISNGDETVYKLYRKGSTYQVSHRFIEANKTRI